MARNILYRLFQLGLVLLLLLSMEHRAYAYIDPGTGFAVAQTVSATIFGVLYFLRRRIKNLFQRKDKLSNKDKISVDSEAWVRSGGCAGGRACSVCLGRTPGEASHHAVVLEAVARMAHFTEALHPSCEPVSRVLLDWHYPANMAQPRPTDRVE